MASAFGVACDNATQNSPALQNAVNAAIAQHRTLYIEAGAGVCFFNTTLNIATTGVDIVYSRADPLLHRIGHRHRYRQHLRSHL